MSLVYDEDDEEGRPRTLSNAGVLSYIAGHWLREPGRFAAVCALVVAAAVCDLTIPWATRALMNAVASPVRVSAAAWRAWAMLSGLYLAIYRRAR